MSSSIWTRCAAEAEHLRLDTRPWRVVEGQHVISTRKLVDSDAEQQLLEDLIETAKPPVPPEPEFEGLHYLLSTSFRYPPLAHGSRFGTRAERGVWYGAEERRTAFAETAYYRLLFLEGTDADLEPVMVDLTAFRTPVRTERALDLTEPPFARHEEEISSPTSYDASQRLGAAMRQEGVEAFRFRSARDAPTRNGAGINVGLFTPRAFAARRPHTLETWYCVATPEAVELSRRDLFRHQAYRFPREQFLVDGKLPAPAL